MLTELLSTAANSRALQGSYTQNEALLIPKHTSKWVGKLPYLYPAGIVSSLECR